MAQERAQAEAELIELLQSAIEKVKHLRLDYVADVQKLFEDAFQFLESNLIVEETSFDTAGRLLGHAQVAPQQMSKGNHFIPKKGVNLNKIRNVTSDYSSPSLGRRKLGGGGGGDGGLLGGRGKKPSSRVGSSRANMLNNSDSDDGSDDEMPPQRNKSLTSSKIGLGLGGGLGGSRANPMMGKPNTAKLMLGAKSFTRDTSSPSLGKRSIGAKKAPSAGGSGLGLGLGSRSSNRTSVLDQENETAPLRAVAPAVSNFHKEVDPVASPANMAASRNLINMAKKDQASHGEGTPKATYLRRLDSPGSNHEKLRQGRESITKMIKKTLEILPRMDLDKYLTIKDKFEMACSKLERGKIVERKPEDL